MNGLDRIIEERRRQLFHKGWTLEHDAEHGRKRLLWAALGKLCASLGIEIRWRYRQPPRIPGRMHINSGVPWHDYEPPWTAFSVAGGSEQLAVEAGALIAAGLDQEEA